MSDFWGNVLLAVVGSVASWFVIAKIQEQIDSNKSLSDRLQTLQKEMQEARLEIYALKNTLNNFEKDFILDFKTSIGIKSDQMVTAVNQVVGTLLSRINELQHFTMNLEVKTGALSQIFDANTEVLESKLGIVTVVKGELQEIKGKVRVIDENYGKIMNYIQGKKDKK